MSQYRTIVGLHLSQYKFELIHCTSPYRLLSKIKNYPLFALKARPMCLE